MEYFAAVVIILLNFVHLIGIGCLFLGHLFIARKQKKGFLFSAAGAFIICIGSFIILSYPLIILNFIWFLISLYGYFKTDKDTNNHIINKSYIYILVFALISLSLFLILNQLFSELAWITTFIYIVFYFLYSNRNISLNTYLMICLFGYLIFIPHLLIYFSFVVLINETSTAIISLKYLLNSIKKII